MIVATEDALSLAVATKLLSASGLDVTVSLGGRGNGYLRAKARELNRTAEAQPVLLLTDLDSPDRCPVTLRAAWFGGAASRHMLFRVAVHEVESWVLADAASFAAFAHVSLGRIPPKPDTEADPKQALINLCRRSTSRDIREGIVPRRGSTASIGPLYNTLLSTFVATSWDPHVASTRSPSLNRALTRMNEHAARR